ncbi:MAG: serine/threonine-protein kinase [Gemmataceae bacterium]
MLSESEKRALHLAVSRYGVDGRKIQQVAHQLTQARSRGEAVDVVSLLEREKLLTQSQGRELRAESAVNGVDSDIHGAATVLPPSDAAPTEEDAFQDLKQLAEFRILRRLGGGGMGSVFLGYQENQHRPVALKVLAPPLAKSPAMVDRFYREGRSGAHLNHPNIVRNLAVGQDKASGLHYLVLEYVDGPSALELIERKGRLSVGDAVHIALDIARALEHAHSRNIVHRDIKPGNILITRTGVAKLADMGLAKRTDESSSLTLARQGFGTPYYMPYEQAMNARTADGRSDIYALGATLYHLLAGEVPFPGANSVEIIDRKALGAFRRAGEIRPGLPAVLDDILARMMALKPADRYQTASEVIVELERSQLAAGVPSFADADQAMQDPVVRQRLSTAGLSTTPDLRQTKPEPQPNGADTEFWYVRYRDRRGQVTKVRLSTPQIQKRLRDGKLPKHAEAASQPQGKYRPLEVYPQFRPAKESAAAPPTGATARSWILYGALAGIVAVIGLVSLTLYLLLR